MKLSPYQFNGGWNKGLTKKTDSRVAANGVAISIALGGTGTRKTKVSLTTIKSCGKAHPWCAICKPNYREFRSWKGWNKGFTKKTNPRVAANGRAISKARMGHEVTPETRAKLRIARLKQVFPKKNTRIERVLREEFAQRGLIFNMHRPMFNLFICDFVFNKAKLIVEADGYPWHINKDHTPLYKAAKAKGWEVWRFTDGLIDKHKHTIGDLVQHYCTSSKVL